MELNTRSVAVISAGVGAVVGATGAYVAMRAGLERKYAAIAEVEIDQAREHYRQLNKADEFADPVTALAALHGGTPEQEAAVEAATIYGASAADMQDLLEQYRGLPDAEKELMKAGLEPVVVDGEVKDASDLVEVSRNVFTDSQTGVTDFDPESEDRSDGRPYIIKFEEFNEGKSGYTQEQLTYYEGDDVLAKDDDELVEDPDGLVGNLNLTKFGLGSQDPNVVYIRNERWEADIEVTRVKTSYAQVVGGYIEHSDKRPPRKFRDIDE